MYFKNYKLFTLIIWLIQPINDETLTYTPGTSILPHPKPQDTNPANSKNPSSWHTSGPPPSPCNHNFRISKQIIKSLVLVLFILRIFNPRLVLFWSSARDHILSIAYIIPILITFEFLYKIRVFTTNAAHKIFRK